MKKWSLLMLALFIAMSLALTACGGGSKKDSDGGSKDGNNEQATDSKWVMKGDPNLVADLEIWAVQPSRLEPLVEGFNKLFPNVKVEIINQGFEVTSKTKVAIAAGKGGPDIVSYHFNESPNFNTGEGLVDLMQPPYNVGQYKDGFTEANWNRWLSVDGKSMYSVPGEHDPKITWYRQDILEDYGYPTDPEELAEYLSDKDNYINMAETFKADGKWITTIRNWDIMLYLGDRGFFDDNLNYNRNDEGLVEIFDLTKQMVQRDLISNQMVVWNDNANRELNVGNIVLLTIEATFGATMKEIAPDTEGKWMVTSLPMGMASAGQGIGLSILEQSKQKEAAWKFLQYAAFTIEGQLALANSDLKTISPLKPVWELPEFIEYVDPFTVGQQTRKIAVQELDKIKPVARPTPLDKIAQPIWEDHINRMLTNNLDSRTTLDAAQRDIEAAVSAEREKLLEVLGIGQ